jgi:hypothetical protein
MANFVQPAEVMALEGPAHAALLARLAERTRAADEPTMR